MNAADHQCASRIVRQHLETSRLMGIDFVPVRCESVLCPEEGTLTDAAAAPSLKTMNGSGADSRPAGGKEAKIAALKALQARHDAECPHCTSVTTHTQTVFGEGNPDAAIMFVGEAPGEEEDRTGRPFVGRAGQKLNDIIRAMGLTRDQVYIANVLKSRPPNNRTPLRHEIEACAPFLMEQIRIIRPQVIVALGGPAAKFLLKTETGITRLRGQWGWLEEDDLRVPVMPTYHPAYLLRNYTVETRQQVWSDMQAVLKRLASPE